MGFSQAPALPYSKLGIVEDGDTASQAIEKDKYVIWKGKNYFAKTDILQGETFVVDTNLIEVTEGAINGLVEMLTASSTDSTTEKLVGKWIDGSPIYRRTLAVTTPWAAETNVSVPHNLNVQVNKIWLVPERSYISWRGNFMPITTRNLNDRLGREMYVDGTNITYWLGLYNVSDQDRNITLYATVEYVKA